MSLFYLTAHSIHTQGMVEKWLLQVQETMILSLKDVMKESVDAYAKIPRNKWVLDWPGQVVIAAGTIYWTEDVTEAIEKGLLKVIHQHVVLRHSINYMIVDCTVRSTCTYVLCIMAYYIQFLCTSILHLCSAMSDMG